MALDFGDAGLFDPLTPQNGKKSNNGNNKKFSFEKNDEDDENENVRLNGGDDSDDGRDIKDDGDDPDQEDFEEDDLPKGFPLDILEDLQILCDRNYRTFVIFLNLIFFTSRN